MSFVVFYIWSSLSWLIALFSSNIYYLRGEVVQPVLLDGPQVPILSHPRLSIVAAIVPTVLCVVRLSFLFRL